MPESLVSMASMQTPNLWKEAYQALCDDETGKEQLHKLNKKLREKLHRPSLNLRSHEGYKQLLDLINNKSRTLSNGKPSSKFAMISSNMNRVKDLVATGASMGGPYIAIPAAALFLIFSVHTTL